MRLSQPRAHLWGRPAVDEALDLEAVAGAEAEPEVIALRHPG